MAVFEFIKDFKKTPPKKKLRLPKEFVSRFGEALSDEVFLKPKYGVAWTIGLKKRDDKVWLRYGWPEFSERFALDQGRFVFFRYQGNSEFSVSICDNRSAVTQIYNDPNPECEANENVEERLGNRGSSDNPIELSDSSSVSWFDEGEDNDEDEDYESQQPPRNSTCKRMRTRATTRSMRSPRNEDLIGSNSESEDLEKLVSFGTLCDRFAARATAKKRDTDGRKKSTPFPSPTEKEMGRQLNDGRKSGNPFFEVSLHKSCVELPRLNLPVQFWRKYLKSRAGDVVLCGSDGHSWTLPMSVIVDPIGYPRARLSGSMWTKFIQHNKLAVGDRCIFELTDGPGMSFNVTISRAANDSDDHPPSDSDYEIGFGSRQKMEARQGKFRKIDSEDDTVGRSKSASSNPCFNATVGKACYYLNVPRAFVLCHFQNKKQTTVILEVGRRSWPVTFLMSSRGYFLGAGYVAFLRQNSLNEGDMCKYELKQGTEAVFEVTIWRRQG